MKKQRCYPANWDQIAAEIKLRAGWRCEACGYPHDLPTGHVLTVHHLDGDPANCAYTNLVALCQRCHLHIQAAYLPGQLFMGAAPWWAAIRALDFPNAVDIRDAINHAVAVPAPVWG